MNKRHIIETVELDISFPSEHEAFAEQAGLGEFISQRLLREVENVFDGCANDDVLRIERLEIDLGEMPYQNYRDHMVERIGDQLREQLSELLPRNRGIVDGKRNDIAVSFKRNETELSVFVHFMHHGHLPWHRRTESPAETQKMFMRVVESDTDAVIRLLYEMGASADMSTRLVGALPIKGVLIIAQRLLHKRFEAISFLVQSLAEMHLAHGWLHQIARQDRDACLRDLWAEALALLLRAEHKNSDVNALSLSILERVAGSNSIRPEKLRLSLVTLVGDALKRPGTDPGLKCLMDALENDRATESVVANRASISVLLSLGDKASLQAMLRSFDACSNKAKLRMVLKDVSLNTQSRRYLIESLSNDELVAWCARIERNQVSFITSCWRIYLDASRRMGATERDAMHGFWDYTLLYYASLSESSFNRGDFFRFLWQRKGEQFTAVMLNAIDSEITASDFGNELNLIVRQMQQKLSHGESIELFKMKSVGAVHLSEWISSCDVKGLKVINEQWDLLVKSHSGLIRRLILSHGPRMAVRRALVKTLSFEQIRDLIGLVDLEAKAFVSDAVMLFSTAFSSTSSTDVKKLPTQGRLLGLSEVGTLWGFAFDFVLVERGSRFNKKEYCRSLLREMSAHNNCSYHSLLNVMQEWFGSVSMRNSYTGELLSILNELSDDLDGLSPADDQFESLDSRALALKSAELDRVFLLKILAQEPPLRDEESVYLNEIVDSFLSNPAARDIDYIRTLLGSQAKARRLALYVTVVQLEKIFEVSSGERYRVLYPHAQLLFEGIANDMDKEARDKLSVDFLVFCCRYLFSGPLLSPTVFVKLLADYLLDLTGGEREIVTPKLISQLEQKSATDTVSAVVFNAVRELLIHDEVKSASNPRPIDSGGTRHPLDNKQRLLADASLDIGEAVYIRNAGLVLLAPYLSMLFERLGLVQHHQFISDETSARAVHVMQYMADGIAGAPEYMMVLNKLMCGVATAQPVVSHVVITQDDKVLIDGLLNAVIANWKGIGNTSIEGLRESFLMREGRLQFKNDQWHLLVESRSYDMLLDSLPWSYAMIKFSWMPHVINVEWR